MPQAGDVLAEVKDFEVTAGQFKLDVPAARKAIDLVKRLHRFLAGKNRHGEIENNEIDRFALFSINIEAFLPIICGEGGIAAIVKNRFREFTNLAAPLANHANDHHIGGGEAAHHAKKHRLADTRSGNDADALAFTNGYERIDSTHPNIKRLIYRLAAERVTTVREAEGGNGQLKTTAACKM